jgi:hypothetical protein
VQQIKDGQQKLFRLFGHFSIVLALGFSSLASASSKQSFEDFKRSQQQSFKNYKDERDKEFNGYLKQQFEGFNAYMSAPLYEKPKPVKIPAAKEIKLKPVGPKVRIKIKEIKPSGAKEKIEYEKEKLKREAEKAKALRLKREKEAAQAKKEAELAAALAAAQADEEKKRKAKEEAKKAEEKARKAAQAKELAKIEEEKRLAAIILALKKEKEKEQNKPKPTEKPKDINFDFYGSELGFNIPKGLKSAKFYPQNQKGISNFFDKAASSKYEKLIKDIQKVSKSMNLNDWGVYLLVLEVSDNIFSDKNESKLLSWFIFNKMGYAVKVGLAKKHIVLMHYSKKTIYSTPNYKINGKKYYVVANYAKGSVGRLFTYRQDYPDATKPLDLSLSTLPKFEKQSKKKTLSFKQYGKTYTFTYEYNKNLIDFMSTYPQADYDTFFNAPLENDTYRDIATDIKKYVDGKKASDAMNFVLNFVQKSFKYERDNQQFGREKVMFAEETLFYEKSDCEDRAILFSYLIKELFHVPVIGVKYSDHMATALYVPIRGDKVVANSKKYVVADPTYINANIGMSMPKYRAKKPQSYIVVKRN